METTLTDPDAQAGAPVGDTDPLDVPTGPDGSDGSDAPGAPGDGAGRSRSARRNAARKQAIEWTVLLGTALVIALLIRTFLVQPFYIPTESMYPTLKKNDRVLVNKLSYRMHDVHRGDVVVFNAPEGEQTGGIKDLIKRVIGLPGDSVEGRDGHVYVDGHLLEEPYLRDSVITTDFGPQEIPAGSIWVMGDNRTQSRDSRFFGPIKESSIVGRAFVRLWPPSRLGFL